jgi:hypothetical protein
MFAKTYKKCKALCKPNKTLKERPCNFKALPNSDYCGIHKNYKPPTSPKEKKDSPKEKKDSPKEKKDSPKEKKDSPKEKKDSPNINYKLLTTANEWINSFYNNKNTGTNYEIMVGLSILLDSGLIDHKDLPEQYKKINSFKKHNNVKGLINLTQQDDIGGTSDLAVVFKNNSIKYFSCTLWKGSIQKCISNPSGSKIYNLNKKDFQEKNEEAFNLALKYRKDNFGELSTKWKRVKGCPGSKHMCEYMAKKSCEEWITMDNIEKKNKLIKLLDIKSSDDIINTNAYGIIFWNKSKNKIENIFKWKLKINLDDYLDVYQDGIYICHGKINNPILKTQAKYNNGIIEGMSSKQDVKQWKIKKSSNYLSSWDCVAIDLTKIFEMEELKTLDE